MVNCQLTIIEQHKNGSNRFRLISKVHQICIYLFRSLFCSFELNKSWWNALFRAAIYPRDGGKTLGTMLSGQKVAHSGAQTSNRWRAAVLHDAAWLSHPTKHCQSDCEFNADCLSLCGSVRWLIAWNDKGPPTLINSINLPATSDPINPFGISTTRNSLSQPQARVRFWQYIQY